MGREKNISTCFRKTVRFKYPETVDDFNTELTFFQRKRQLDNDIDIVMGEDNIFNELIVMDNVSGLADKSNDFANFLTVSRKFNFTCVHVFHAMYPNISSQTKIFNIFPGSLRNPSMIKILSRYCNRYTYENIPRLLVEQAIL